jgi:PAS domain S-box-containing protein
MAESASSVLVVDPAEEARGAIADRVADDPDVTIETVGEVPSTTRLLEYDGVVTEYDLGNDTGLDLIEQLRAAGAGLPIVLLTDADPATFAERAFVVGVDGYVPKGETDAFETALEMIDRQIGDRRGESGLAHRYERLLEQDVIGVYVIQNGTLTYCNDRVAEMWGYEQSAAMIGKPVLEFIHPEYRESVRENVARVLEGDVVQRRIAGLDAAGDRIEIEVHSWRIDSEGARAVMGVCQNVTGRVERRRQLEAQNDRLETMASVISHDLRNPLNVATGYVELLEEDVDDERLETVAGALERIQDITDDLLTMSRQSQRSIEPEALSLERAAREAWQTVETGDAELTIDGDRAIEADPNRLAQCLENLFANAVEHGSTSPPSASPQEDAVEHGGATVTVSVEPIEDGFAVADTGGGIDLEVRDRIFERGYTTEQQNTGLGMAIVQSVAESHDWDVSVGESETGGARFEFRGVTDVPDRE